VLPGEQKIGQLSRGERAGVNLALALAQSPELLILDEPTLGLDVVAKRAFLEALLFTSSTTARPSSTARTRWTRSSASPTTW
jgi:ABC-2 type transport system ATP-binding protein